MYGGINISLRDHPSLFHLLYKCWYTYVYFFDVFFFSSSKHKRFPFSIYLVTEFKKKNQEIALIGFDIHILSFSIEKKFLLILWIKMENNTESVSKALTISFSLTLLKYKIFQCPFLFFCGGYIILTYYFKLDDGIIYFSLLYFKKEIHWKFNGNSYQITLTNIKDDMLE